MPMNKKFRSEWVKAGYEVFPGSGKTDMGSAEVTRPPDKDFIRLYHILSADYAISNIAFQRMKVAKFSDLNDPFELLAANFKDTKIRKIIGEYKEAFDKQYGLLCFSSNWINPLLWSHYGNKHSGICLGFDVHRPRIEVVKYQEERLDIPSLREGAPFHISLDLMKDLLTTKFSDWRYEKEYRIIFHLLDTYVEGPLRFKSFDDGLQLREIILGPTCTVGLDAIRKLAEPLFPDAVIFRARLAHKFFSVVPDEDTVPLAEN